jgi:uncharacterized membrane protein
MEAGGRRKECGFMQLSSLLVFALVLCAASQGSAQGYIDPGSGAYLFQLAAAALFGVLYAVKSYWREIRGAVSRWRGRRSGARGEQ